MFPRPANSSRNLPLLLAFVLALILGGWMLWFSGADERREKRIRDARATFSQDGDTVEGSPRRRALETLIRAKQSLAGADLTHWDLREMDFSGIDLKGADFSGANVVFADLKGADLEGATFKQANLIGSNLTRANLSRAEISHADVSLANFRQANLRGVRFQNADLAEVQFAAANLAAATFEDVENLETRLIKEAWWDDATVWPAGFESRMREAGLPCIRPMPGG